MKPGLLVLDIYLFRAKSEKIYCITERPAGGVILPSDFKYSSHLNMSIVFMPGKKIMYLFMLL